MPSSSPSEPDAARARSLASRRPSGASCHLSHATSASVGVRPAALVGRAFVAGLIAAAGLVGLDRIVRVDVHAPEAWHAAFGITVAVIGAQVLAIVVWLLLAWMVGRLLAPRAARIARPFAALFAGVGLGAYLLPRFQSVFERRAMVDASAARWPWLLAGAGIVACAVLVWLCVWALDKNTRGTPWPRRLLGIGLCATAAGFVYADMNVLVSLYASLHATAEFLAVALFVLGFLLLTVELEQLRWLDRPLSVTAVVIALACIGGVYDEHHRDRTTDALSAFRRDPIYVGRMLERVAWAEAMREGHLSDESIAQNRLERLLQRYDVAAATLHPDWSAPFTESDAVERGVRELREDLPMQPNVVVFYVDTLRQDTAYDPTWMPNVVDFANESVRFDRAYSTGSDTLSSLPGLVGCTYDIAGPIDTTLMDLAQQGGLSTTLMISKSVDEFLTELLPLFEFQKRLSFEDYQHAGVWGYGADGATASPIVDTALAWMANKTEEPFFLWLFHFDVHNWRELDAGYIDTLAHRFSIPDSIEDRRYYVAARGVDEAFGRLIDGIDELGLRDDTIVLFVSDHGEALGPKFKVHAVFLYESLIKVPLVMRVPGVRPAVVPQPVSLIDVPPTIGRFMMNAPPIEHCHGEDLLSYLLPDRPPRRHPILFRATQHTKLARLGILHDELKLVQRADWDDPELYDLARPSPDDTDVAAENPGKVLELLGRLVRSPMFVRVRDGLLD